jgi:hypothetical protein
MFTRFEKQFSTKVAWSQPSKRVRPQMTNILWGYRKRTNQQMRSMLVVNVQSFRYQLKESYLLFYVCSSLSLMTTLYYLSRRGIRERDSWLYWLRISTKCYLRIFSYPKAIVIWVESDATSWVKTFIRYQSMSSLENHYQSKDVARP